MAAKPVCKVDAKICAWTDKIVGVKTPNMVASGFKISPDLIVTNRHVAEDHLRVLVRNAEGKVQPAVSLPHDFPADLVLLRLEDSQPDLNLKLNSPSRNQKSFMLWRLIKAGMGLAFIRLENLHIILIQPPYHRPVFTLMRELCQETAAVRSWMNMVGCWVS